MRLDENELERLRAALAAVKRCQGRRVPREVLANLSDVLPPNVGLTIDFDAAQTLGQPIVILRPIDRPDPCFAALSPREREVAGLVATGLRNRDIAVALDITVATVKDHVHRILTKAGLDSRAAIAAAWRR